jgi:hypothetical protein
MLYKGSQAKYTYEIAQHEAHEDELREQGWIGFYDLPEQSESEKVGEIYSTDLKASDEALAEAKAEIERLHKKLRIKELEDTSADDLKALLTERNIPFGARDSKAVLLNLVIESDGGE